MRNFILSVIIMTTSFATVAQDHDAEYVKLVKEYTLHHDGSYDVHYRSELKLLTHFSFHRLFGETFILYDPAYQEVKINEAYTIMADGAKVEVPGNAYNELLPRFATDAPAYNRMRELAVTHTGLERGATVHLDYTVHVKSGFMPFFMEALKLREAVPVKEMEIIVKAPQDILIKYNTFNLRTSPSTYSDDGNTIYNWSFRDLQPAPRKPFAPSDSEPCLAFTMARDMEWAFFRIVNQEAFQHKLGPALSSRVETMIKKEQDEILVMKELQQWVVDELKTVVVPGELNPFRARTSQVAWESGYATPLEKAIILSDLLIAAGINAFPAYIFPERYYDPDVGVPLLADRIMVQVNPRKYDRYYLSVEHTNDRNELYILGNDKIFPIDGARESLRAMTEKQVTSEMFIEGDLRLDISGRMEGNLDLMLENYAHPYLGLVSDTAALKKVMGGSLSGHDIKGIEIHKLEGSRSQSTLNISDKDAVTRYDNFMQLGLPEFSKGTGSFRFDLISGERSAPVEVPFLVNEIYEIRISLPEGVSLVNKTGEMEVDNDIASLRIVLAAKNNEIIVHRSVEWHKNRVETNELGQLRAVIDAWYDHRYRELFLESK